MASRRQWAWGLGVGLPLVALALFLALFRWDWLIPIIEAQAAVRLGRPVTLQHLHVSLGRTIRVTAEGLRVGNPEGFPEDPPFAELPRGTVDVAFAPLLRGKVVIPAVELEQPKVEMIGRPDGSTNYAFHAAGPAGEGSGEGGPQIGALRIRDGHVHAAIANLKADFAVNLNTEDPAGGDPALLADAKGTYAALPIEARFRGGAVLNLRDAEKPWPVQLDLSNGPTRVALRGTLKDPVKLAGANLRLDVQTPDMALISPLIGVPITRTPPFRATGRLDYAEGRFRFTDVEGRVGNSDVSGAYTVSTGDRTVFTADLHSRRVDLADLGGLIGGTPGRAGTPGQTPEQRREVARAEASPRLLPTTPISIPSLKKADMHVRYSADSIRGQGIPFDGLEMVLDIEDGVIRLHPGTFKVGRGEIAADLTLSPQENGIPHAKAQIELRRVDISRLMQAAGAGGAGTLGGVGRIESTGRSVSELLGNGNGELTVVSVGGNLSALLADLSGFEFGKALLSALGLPQRTQVECLIGDFGLTRGALRVRTLLLDTDSHIVTGSGVAGLGKEVLDLRLRTDSKRFSIGSLPTDIAITGTFKNPSIAPEVGELAARAGAAVGLGVLFAPLALLPTIQLGVGENSQCERLTQTAQGREAQQQR
ncbi:AsmA family protein [Paracraurococcus lichenis]|uniref:AsmA family protein n=1 Tax=Paracraurococcus lichenis TaxID=3064888 RepID=A0ABT9DTQ7_9PROT|nr:AsmA family protein [Paracraurococcus sp. LOR1-02]MDO9707288.1 AsmA family protein [Paracraurococcus sp. LOR1-02]